MPEIWILPSPCLSHGRPTVLSFIAPAPLLIQGPEKPPAPAKPEGAATTVAASTWYLATESQLRLALCLAGCCAQCVRLRCISKLSMHVTAARGQYGMGCSDSACDAGPPHGNRIDAAWLHGVMPLHCLGFRGPVNWVLDVGRMRVFCCFIVSVYHLAIT